MDFESRYQKVLKKCTSPKWMGVTASYFRKETPNSDSVEIEGVASRQAIEIISANGAFSKSRQATFGVNLIALEELGVIPKEGDFLEIKSMRFRIKDMDPDGEGFSRLILTKVGT